MRRLLLVIAFAACTTEKPLLPPTDLGALSKPTVVTARDGGDSVLVGKNVLWLFGDSLMTITGADGFNYRSSTVAWGAPGSLALTEALDANGAPFQAFPYSADEAAYNKANGPTERYALWPGSAIAAPDGSGAWIFVQRLKVHPGDLNYEFVDVEVARLPNGSTIAPRDASPLFSAPLPSYSLGAVVDSGLVYLYSSDPVAGQLDTISKIVRSPVNSASNAASWQAWDGSRWNSDLTKAQPILHGPPGDLSVSYNAHLGKFLAVFSAIFSNDISYATASHPEGPWSPSQKLMTGMSPASGNDYAGKEHPELSSNGGKQIVVSYARGTGTFTGEVRLSSITLP
jgi:hypothetical protein